MSADGQLDEMRALVDKLLAITGMSHTRMVSHVMGAMQTGNVIAEGIDVQTRRDDDGWLVVEITSKTILGLPAPDDGEIDF